MSEKSSCKNSLRDYHLTIDNKGKVYNCCFQVFPLKGNVIHEKLDNIVEKSKKDRNLSSLEKGGIWKLARADGWDKDFIDWAQENAGNCGFCYKAYVEPYEE